MILTYRGDCGEHVNVFNKNKKTKLKLKRHCLLPWRDKENSEEKNYGVLCSAATLPAASVLGMLK